MNELKILYKIINIIIFRKNTNSITGIQNDSLLDGIIKKCDSALLNVIKIGRMNNTLI